MESVHKEIETRLDRCLSIIDKYQKIGNKEMTEVAVLQVWSDLINSGSGGFLVVKVFGGENRVQLAEQEASLRGYTRWSVSEFAVMGGDNA